VTGAPDRMAALRRRAILASVSVAGTLAMVKLTAWLITGSVAVLSSLLDSTMDVAASLVMFYAVRVSLEPPDRSHRYGHGKAEPLGALAQAAFIVGSGLFLIFEAVGRFITPQPVMEVTVGYVVMAISIVLTLGLVTYQRRVIRETRSLAIRADWLHYVGDLGMNLAVIVSLVLAVEIGWTWADPVFAVGIALILMHSAVKVALSALDQLMDRELPADQRRRIARILRAHPEVVDFHDLRSRESGMRRFIEVHVELDPTMTVEAAHEICDQLEAELSDAFRNADILIHQEPAGLEDDRLDSVIANGGR